MIAGIHRGHINLEAWNVSADLDMSGKTFDDLAQDDDAFTAGVELELSAVQAQALVDKLQTCLRELAESVGAGQAPADLLSK